MLTARSGCTLAPTALTQLSNIHFKAPEQGPGDEAASIPLCIRDTCPHL